MSSFETNMRDLFDAAEHARSFHLCSAVVHEWARDIVVDTTFADLHIRLVHEDFRRGVRCGLQGSSHPQPWDVPQRADLSWGAAVIDWLDDVLGSGGPADAVAIDDTGVLYFELDDHGLVRR